MRETNFYLLLGLLSLLGALCFFIGWVVKKIEHPEKPLFNFSSPSSVQIASGRLFLLFAAVLLLLKAC
jgi:hypothetical protein